MVEHIVQVFHQHSLYPLSAMLSPCQHRLFDWVEDFITQHGMAPTYDEIKDGLGYSSKAPVQYHLQVLLQDGFVTFSSQFRSIRILKPKRCVLLLGTIAAHSLVTVFPDGEAQPIPLAFFPKFIHLSTHELCRYFALRVQGDSMIEANIVDDDVVILKREPDTDNIRDNSIVAARVGDATTLKHYQRKGNQIILKPANSTYQPTVINAEEIEVEIQGVYAGLLRGII